MQTAPFQPNTLYYGDCLEVMRAWDAACVDLIYLDPPFNSKVDYNILFGNQARGAEKVDLAQTTAFADTWYWDENAQVRVDNIKRAVAHPAHRAIDALSRIYPISPAPGSRPSAMFGTFRFSTRCPKSDSVIRRKSHCRCWSELFKPAPTKAMSCWTRFAVAAPPSTRRIT